MPTRLPGAPTPTLAVRWGEDESRCVARRRSVGRGAPSPVASSGSAVPRHNRSGGLRARPHRPLLVPSGAPPRRPSVAASGARGRFRGCPVMTRRGGPMGCPAPSGSGEESSPVGMAERSQGDAAPAPASLGFRSASRPSIVSTGIPCRNRSHRWRTPRSHRGNWS